MAWAHSCEHLENSNNWHPSAASTGNEWHSHTSFSKHTHLQPFLLLAIYSQKEKLKIKSVKLEFFLRFSIARTRQNNKKLPRLLYMVQVGSQKYRRMSKFFSFLYLSCGQIWLNLPKDDCHFGYITKLTGKILYISLCGTCFFSYCMIRLPPPTLSHHASPLSCISLPQCTSALDTPPSSPCGQNSARV
jgi:hypothetical protein